MTKNEITQNAVLMWVEHRDMSRAGDVLQAVEAMLIKIYNDRYRRLSEVRGLSKADMLQEGRIGVLHALEKYNPEKGTFSTYAMYWIISYMQKYLNRNSTALSIADSSLWRTLCGKYDLYRDELTNDNPHVSTHDVYQQIATRVGCSVDFVHTFVQMRQVACELGGYQGDMILDKSPNPEDITEVTQRAKLVNECCSRLQLDAESVQYDILYDRIMSSDPDTLQAIANRHGITRERVRQIEAVIKRNLITLIKKTLDEDYANFA